MSDPLDAGAEPAEGDQGAVFVYRHRVRYHETDAQHHVYSARYLEYVDVAFTEFLRELGWDYADAVRSGFDPVLARAEIDFQMGARFDDTLDILVVPTRVGRSSFDIRFEIRSDREAGVAAVSVAYVNFDTGSRASVPIPEAIRERLEARVPEAEA